NGNDIYLTQGTDQVKLDGMADGSGKTGVGQVQFADGTVWTAAQVNTMARTFVGTSGDDTLNGTTGNDVFDGKGGSDIEYGRGGSDTYTVDAGSGLLTVVNGSSSNNTAAGNLLINDLNPDNLWLKQVGSDLQVDVMGSNTSATIQNWFSNAYSRLAEITVSGGTAGNMAIDSQIDQLVQAMATFSANNSGFDPTSSANPTITDSTLLATVNSVWHQNP
ncbi:hemolysin, partial [Burkholderia sp. Bp9143]|uniref:calcium-binding protein n=1 Tax=Burkholderia sp. Bp9143 TaxID=2184574 RepID=UPI000F9B9C0B